MNKERNYPLIYIILVNWNQRQDIGKCLSSIKKLDYTNYKVVVVDNGSKDGSVSLIKKGFQSVKLIETGRNLGFAGASNIGVNYALKTKSKYILLLNSDTVVHEKLLIELVIAAEKIPCAGVLGPMIYFYDEPQKIWFAGGEIDPNTGRFEHIGEGERAGENADNGVRECGYITGCAMFVPAKVFRDIGLLDETYFMYYEDSDFCVRANRRGYKILLVPKAKVWHKKEKNFTPLYYYYYSTRNRLYFIKKFSSKRTLFQVYRGIKSSIVFTVKAQSLFAGYMAFKGAIDYFKFLNGAMEIRK